jgi:hypothetical protein
MRFLTRHVLGATLLLTAACGGSTTVVVTSPAAAPTTSSFALPSPSTPDSVIFTYEIQADTGPGLPEKPMTITYSTGFGTRTVHTTDQNWSRNVEIENGADIYLFVQASIFTSVSCDADSLFALNTLKGREDVAHGGWTCEVKRRSVSW